VKNSPSLATIRQLVGVALRVHDPVVPASVAGSDATGASEPLEATAGAQALMILTPWPDYRRIAPVDIARSLRGRIVLDPYAVLDRKAAEAAGLVYYTLGRRAACGPASLNTAS
jgi:UDPglucose 6-dehydrogenase